MELDRLVTFEKSKGFDSTVEINEEKIAHLLNQILTPVTDITSLFNLLTCIGEVRGIKGVFSSVTSKIEALRFDIDGLLTDTESEEEDG